MYMRAEGISGLTDLLTAMKQNIAIMTNDAVTAKNIGQRSTFSDYTKLTPTESVSDARKYSAWAGSFIDLAVRAGGEFNKKNIDDLITKNVVTKEDVQKIALFIDLALQTDKIQLMHYSTKLQSEAGRTEFANKIQEAIKGYLPPDKEDKQRDLLSSANMKFESQKNQPLAQTIHNSQVEMREKDRQKQMAEYAAHRPDALFHPPKPKEKRSVIERIGESITRKFGR